MEEYEVDSLVEMPDDNRVVRHGPVFEDSRDAAWYVRMARRMHIPAWIAKVDVEGEHNARVGS